MSTVFQVKTERSRCMSRREKCRQLEFSKGDLLVVGQGLVWHGFEFSRVGGSNRNRQVSVQTLQEGVDALDVIPVSMRNQQALWCRLAGGLDQFTGLVGRVNNYALIGPWAAKQIGVIGESGNVTAEVEVRG